MKATHAQLDELLQPNAAARERSAAVQAEIAALDGNAVVLFGAGRLGRIALEGLRREGLKPLAFADNNRQRWGQQEQGLPIYSPEDAARRFGKQTPFVVTIYTGAAVRKQLRDLGLRTVPFS